MCASNLSVLGNVLSHWLHRYVFSPVWDIMCVFKFWLIEDDLWQVLHWYGFWPYVPLCVFLSSCLLKTTCHNDCIDMLFRQYEPSYVFWSAGLMKTTCHNDYIDMVSPQYEPLCDLLNCYFLKISYHKNCIDMTVLLCVLLCGF